MSANLLAILCDLIDAIAAATTLNEAQAAAANASMALDDAQEPPAFTECPGGCIRPIDTE